MPEYMASFINLHFYICNINGYCTQLLHFHSPVMLPHMAGFSSVCSINRRRQPSHWTNTHTFDPIGTDDCQVAERGQKQTDGGFTGSLLINVILLCASTQLKHGNR